MSSLASSLGHVSLVTHCANSLGPSSASSWQRPSHRKLSCYSSVPTPSTSAMPSILQSTHENCHRASEAELTKALVSDSPQASVVHDYRGSATQSVLSLVVALALTIGIQGAPSSRDTFEDVPQTLSGGDKGQRIQKPKSAKAETCTRKCVSTCVRGGAGSGEGPLNVRRPLVVFKEGFRSRQYWI